MRTALLIALSLSSLSACASAPEVSGEAPVARFFRAACVASGMKQAALTKMARERGWPATPHEVSSITDQAVSYSDGAFEVVLQQTDNTTVETEADGARATIPASRNCTVTAPSPVGPWRSDVALLAAEMGYIDAELDGPPFDGETKDWARPDGYLVWQQQASDGKLLIQIYSVTDPSIRFPL